MYMFIYTICIIESNVYKLKFKIDHASSEVAMNPRMRAIDAAASLGPPIQASGVLRPPRAGLALPFTAGAGRPPRVGLAAR